MEQKKEACHIYLIKMGTNKTRLAVVRVRAHLNI